MMKKRNVVLAGMLLLCMLLCAGTASAGLDRTYALDKAGMSINVPLDAMWFAYTEQSLQESDFLSAFADSLLGDADALILFSDYDTLSITIDLSDMENMEDLNLYSDERLTANLGENEQLYWNGQQKFVATRESQYDYMTYFTVKNHCLVYCFVNECPVEGSKEDVLIQEVINSFIFH